MSGSTVSGNTLQGIQNSAGTALINESTLLSRIPRKIANIATGTQITGNGLEGILNNTLGMLTVQGATVTGNTLTGIQNNNGTAVVESMSMMTNNTAGGLVNENGGILTLRDSTVDMNGGCGLFNTGLGSTATLQNVGVTNHPLQGIEMTASAIASVTMGSVISGNGMESILNEGGGSLTVVDSTLSSAGVALSENMSTGNLIVSSHTNITGSTGILLMDTATTSVNISNTMITATSVGIDMDRVAGPHVIDTVMISGAFNGIIVSDPGAGPMVKDVRILNSTLSGIGRRGIEILSRTGDVYVINGNTLSGGDRHGIRMRLFGAGNNVEVIGNMVSSFGREGILMQLREEATTLISNNTINAVTRDAIDVIVRDDATAVRNITIVDNHQMNANVGFPGFRVRRSNGAPTCVTLLSSTRAPLAANDIQLSNGNGNNQFLVFDLPNLSANNNNLSVQQPGSPVFNTLAPCPLPVIP